LARASGQGREAGGLRGSGGKVSWQLGGLFGPDAMFRLHRTEYSVTTPGCSEGGSPRRSIGGGCAADSEAVRLKFDGAQSARCGGIGRRQIRHVRAGGCLPHIWTGENRAEIRSATCQAQAIRYLLRAAKSPLLKGSLCGRCSGGDFCAAARCARLAHTERPVSGCKHALRFGATG